MSLPQGYLGYFFRSSSVLVASGKNSYLISSLGKRRERLQPGNGRGEGGKTKWEILTHNLSFNEPESMDKLPQDPHTNSASIPSLGRATRANRDRFRAAGWEPLATTPCCWEFSGADTDWTSPTTETNAISWSKFLFKNNLFSAFKIFLSHPNDFNVQLHYWGMNVMNYVVISGEFIGFPIWVYSLFYIKCILTLQFYTAPLRIQPSVVTKWIFFKFGWQNRASLELQLLQDTLAESVEGKYSLVVVSTLWLWSALTGYGQYSLFMVSTPWL